MDEEPPQLAAGWIATVAVIVVLLVLALIAFVVLDATTG